MKKGFYIHIPFCSSKCNYCSFYSSTDLNLKGEFLKALQREIEIKRKIFSNFFTDNRKTTLYIGGGNPAILDNTELESLFFILKGLSSDFSEVTIELNPDNVTKEKLKLLKSFGVNRVSLGIQSFCDNVLEFLGRRHNLRASLTALENTAKLFDNYSIDMIGGIPSVERDWKNEFSFVKAFLPPHISFYLLSVEEGTRFFGRLKLDDDLQSNEYHNFCNFLAEHDYEQYEVSNFCRDGYYAEHNLLYWDGEDYLGFGPSASSFLKEASIRLKNTSSVRHYINHPEDFEVERLTQEDRFLETVFLSLRTSKGMNLEIIKSEYPSFFEKLKTHIDLLKKEGYLIESGKNVTIPKQHRLVMNEIVLNLIKES